MQAIDLTQRGQRRAVMALTVVYPLVWLLAFANLFPSVTVSKFAAVPAFPLMLVSAGGAFSVIRGAHRGRPASFFQRSTIYLAWGWLVPFCLISFAAVSGFAWLWPALAILILPALVFLLVPAGRERGLLTVAGCITLAGLALWLSSAAEVSFKARLLVALVLTAGPFWSVAGYAMLFEHVLQERGREPDGTREGRMALAVCLIGIGLFIAAVFGMGLIAVSGFR